LRDIFPHLAHISGKTERMFFSSTFYHSSIIGQVSSWIPIRTPGTDSGWDHIRLGEGMRFPIRVRLFLFVFYLRVRASRDRGRVPLKFGL